MQLVNKDKYIHVLQYLSTSMIIACVHCLLSLLLWYDFLYCICTLFLDNIYDKKLLVIIQCFEHWWFELKCIELFIQMFIDHQTLKIFMKNKQLSQQQVNYLNILSKFNFQIIFKSDKINIKVNALIKMFLTNVSESVQCLENHFQTILTFNKVNVLFIESEANLYQQV